MVAEADMDAARSSGQQGRRADGRLVSEETKGKLENALKSNSRAKAGRCGQRVTEGICEIGKKLT